MEKSYEFAEAAGLRFVQRNQTAETSVICPDHSNANSETITYKTTVPDTNFEAQAAKKSAVELGYFQDEFIKHFVNGNYKDEFDAYNRRSYWLRLIVMRSVQNQFLRKVGDQSDQIERQVINLGCGFDTSAFNLFQNKSKFANFTFYEFDLPVVAQKKAEILMKTPEIQAMLEPEERTLENHSLVSSKNYKLDFCDLYDLAALEKKLRSSGIDFDKPTLVVTEYVLPYIESKQIKSIIEFFASHFSCIAMIDNGVTNLGDEHGRKILAYNQERNIPLPSVDFYFSPEILETNYESFGFKFTLESMENLYNKHIDQQERSRVDQIEVLENPSFELAEMKHYFISLSKKCARNAQECFSAPVARLDISTSSMMRTTKP